MKDVIMWKCRDTPFGYSVIEKLRNPSVMMTGKRIENFDQIKKDELYSAQLGIDAWLPRHVWGKYIWPTRKACKDANPSALR